MSQKSIEKLILTCLDTLKQLDFKEGTIKGHRRHFKLLKDYMRMNVQNLYNETIGEKYQLDIFTEGNATDYKMKCIKHSINPLNDMLNHVPMRKKRIHLRTFPLPGEFGKHVQAYLQQLKAESRPADHTMQMYITALSHFIARMQQDHVCLENLDNVAISRFVASLQNTQLCICGPVRRFLSYLFEMNLTKTDLGIPLFYIKRHRKEKVPSVYNAEEIRKIDASIEIEHSWEPDYAIFLLASRLGLRASDICSLQFCNLDWDRNVINLVQCKTKKEIELPLLAIIGDAIIDYIRRFQTKKRVSGKGLQ